MRYSRQIQQLGLCVLFVLAMLTVILVLGDRSKRQSPHKGDANTSITRSSKRRLDEAVPSAIGRSVIENARSAHRIGTESLPPVRVVHRQMRLDSEGYAVLSEKKETLKDGLVRHVRILRDVEGEQAPLLRVEDVLEEHVEGMVDAKGFGDPKISRREVMVADHVLVVLRPGVQEDELKALVVGLGASIKRKLRVPGLESYVVRISERDVDALPRAVARFMRMANQIALAEPDHLVFACDVVQPDDPKFGDQWGLHNVGQTGGLEDADIDAPEAWQRGTGSHDVTVGVIDLGIDYTHPDLEGNIWVNAGEVPGNGIDDDGNGYVDDVRGWDFVNDDNDPMDDDFHGTHVAGVIGAVGDNHVGISGVCWRVRLAALKFLNHYGSGLTSDAAEAVAYAGAMGMDVTCNSWQGGTRSEILRMAIESAAVRGCLFVAAAGNIQHDLDSKPLFPASYECSNIVVVAATDPFDKLAWFSNFGLKGPLIAAPGVSILSTMPVRMTLSMEEYWLAPNYDYLDGTSMAAPLVAGAAALLKSQQPRLSVEALKARLLAGSEAVAGLQGKIPDARRLNLHRVLDSSLPPRLARLHARDFTYDDREGNGDHGANPGEVVQLTFNLANLGDQPADDVTVQWESPDAGVSVQGNPVIALGSLAPQRETALPRLVRLLLAGALPDEHLVRGNFVIRRRDAEPELVPYEFPVIVREPLALEQLDFEPGPLASDPVRNRLYMLDPAKRCILAIDTDIGRTVKRVFLHEPGEVLPLLYGSYLDMAISPDGERLYVADDEMHVFSLPGLEKVRRWPVPFSARAIACDNQERLFITAETSLGDGNSIYEFNALDGERKTGVDENRYRGGYLRSTPSQGHMYTGRILPSLRSTMNLARPSSISPRNVR